MTARLQGGAPWFTPELRTVVVRLLQEQVQRSDARVLAKCVMPNHLHVVLRQGDEPLHRFFQPLLRRIAVRVQAAHGLSGHVFGQPFAEFLCGDPEYLRNAIVYTHLNPVREGLCVGCHEYDWSSHHEYANPVGRALAFVNEFGLPLFASSRDRSIEGMQSDYATFVEWRLRMDAAARCEADGDTATVRPPRPCTIAGDCYWQDRLSPRRDGVDELSCIRENARPARRPDLRDLALTVLQDRDVDVAVLELVRSRVRSPRLVELRHAVIRRAHMYGYRGVDIASFLRVSSTTISRALQPADQTVLCA